MLNVIQVDRESYIPLKWGVTMSSKQLEALWEAPTYRRTPAPRPAPQPAPDVPLQFRPPWYEGGGKIRPDRKALWVKTLRGDRFYQIHGRYQDAYNGRCGMGVANTLAGEHGYETEAWLGLSDEAFRNLYNEVINMNDRTKPASFAEIADYIEATY